MSTAIFTFDHGQKKLHNAIGVKEEYIKDLASTIAHFIKSLKCDEEKEELNDVSPSQIVEALLHDFSYSQLILMSSFYIREKIEEIEKQALGKYLKQSLLSSDDLPDEIKDMIRKLKEDNYGDDE